MASEDPIVIVGYARTPIGAFQGSLKDITATELGAHAIKGALKSAEITPEKIDEVFMGCVLSAGLGQAPARQAALKADLPESVPCSTINKVCGSGMKSVMLGYDAILASDELSKIIVAGGMESMTRAPYLLSEARSGYKMGNKKVYDHMFLDGLEDAGSDHKLMGVFADETAKKYKITREQQDEFTLRSLELATAATKNNWFANEICALDDITIDEVPTKARPEKIPKLKPAFTPDGSVTAANSSSIADGASALILMRESYAKEIGAKPIAKILGHAQSSQAPARFTTAPIKATEKLLSKINKTTDDIDLYEINEAFAVVTLVAIKELKLDIQKVNVFGGACALGHPLGSSGARVICTLLSALQQRNKKIGLATVCIGGGEATAIALELY